MGCAGTAIVQFARHMHQVKTAYALKLFQSQAALEAELKLYESEALSQLLPPILAMYSAGEVVTGGWTLPPFLVVDAGEGLDEWFSRMKPDFFEATVV